MKTILSIITGYIALYTVIWMHEVGHAFFYQLFGCKKCFLHVSVKPYLFFSTPSPVDEYKADRISPHQDLIISYAGIGVNLAAALVTGCLLWKHGPKQSLPGLFLLQFLTLHLAEAVSYLLIGNLYPVSDMKNISDIVPQLRFVNLFAGILICIPYIIILMRIPNDFLAIVLFYNVFTILCMGIGRIVFTKLSD